MKLTHLHDENAVRDVVESGNVNKPYAMVIGGTWCPNCKALMNSLTTEQDKITNDVDVYFYEIQKQGDLDGSYLTGDIEKKLGEAVQQLPFVIYRDFLGTTKVGGMTMVDIAIKKINALAAPVAEKAEPEEESGDFECENCHV